MELNESLIAEFRHEAATTLRMLERIPADALEFRPHEKSRTLGEIALHIANLPGLFIAPLDREEFDRDDYRVSVTPNSDLIERFSRNSVDALRTLKSLTNDALFSSWKYKSGDTVIFEMPRLAAIRAMALNHLIHHRGQLSVYLRMLGIPLPGAYGPSADEEA